MKGHVAVVTGAANGIGRAVAKKFRKNGYRVALLDKKFSSKYSQDASLCYEIDVTNSEQVRRVFQTINSELGDIDILVNAVGGTLHTKSIEAIEDSDWNATIDLNLRTVFNCTREVISGMKKHGWGRVVNISAVAGRTSTFFGGVDFTASKAALIGFTRQCAFELAPYGITVNAVAPGLTLTERVGAMWDEYSEEKRTSILEQIPVGRPSTVEEQADTICFLCSEQASYICGSTLDINGAMFVG
ncbi:3-oxoacyl-[acyl-carrier protein] reductase [Halobacillus karajensis]|uniref:SDR family NAD(P)-dependent oxidoreductase n=1 Tax=Halobacillus karajensis TaxID=195088 RepID=UPI0008A73AF0|nr:SDR family NAD(P)-dependent oxidoreductase [Halobacillus karajensis]SEH77191.1 3-oxoacyl-[acyl-carrier protein] reductase [Halobacillus karajensis]